MINSTQRERHLTQPDVFVVELTDSSWHFHLMVSGYKSTSCGRTEQISRVLPLSTWKGAPGFFPVSWCARCASKIGVGDRQHQLVAFQNDILAKYAGIKPAWSELSLEFATRDQGGSGYSIPGAQAPAIPKFKARRSSEEHFLHTT